MKACGQQQLLLSFDYGQHAEEELAVAAVCASMLDAEHVVHKLDFSFMQGVSLINKHASLREHMALYVPNRNIIFLALAYAYAQVKRAQAVAIGVEAGEDALFPDNSPGVLDAYSAMQKLVIADVMLLSPLENLMKSEVIRLGAALGVDFAYTWSCYDKQRIHCGVCRACAGRKAAFAQTDIPDPTVYAK